MAAVEEGIYNLELVENREGADGSVFKKHYMGPEFTVFTDRTNAGLSGIKCWNKDEAYIVCGNLYKLTHTVAKVFVVDSPEHVGYAVLKDVNEGLTPTVLYYFVRNEECKYVRIPLDQTKDYAFYLGEKKYSLAANGIVTEAKKEKQELQDDGDRKNKSFLTNKSFGSPFLFSSSSSREFTDKPQQSNDKLKKGRGFFKLKSSSSFSSPEIENIAFSPDRANSVSPKIESISSSSKMDRASSASPKAKSVRFAKG